MKKSTLIFILLGPFVFLIGQTGGAILLPQDEKASNSDRSSTAIYAELGGPAILSLNVESSIPTSHNQFISFGTGLGFNQTDIFTSLFTLTNPKTFTVIPIHSTYSFGKKHCFEVGINAAFVLGSEEKPFFASPIIGYRLYPFHRMRGLMLRLYVQPPLSGILSGGTPRNNLFDEYLIAPVGISVGFSL